MKLIAPRAVVHVRDLDLAFNLLSRGLSQVLLGSQYVHPGDLKWWIFNWLNGEGISDAVFLWEDFERPQPAKGLALFFPWGPFSVFVDPSVVGSNSANEFFDWAERRAHSIALTNGRSEVHCVNVASSNEIFLLALRTRAFLHLPEDLILMLLDLKTVPVAKITFEGFVHRQVEASDIPARAKAQHRAFSSSLPLEEYQQNYAKFSVSPGYLDGIDLVLVAPDGVVAGFCIVWPDKESGVGLVEPVGVDPDFRNLGLGTSLLLYGIQLLRSLGMTAARVSVLADNPRAKGLYEKVGFREVDRFVLHEQRLVEKASVVL